MFSEDTKIKIIREIDFSEACISLREDGIVYVFYKDNTILDIDLQLKMVDLFNDITAFKKAKFIFDAGESVTITKEARDNAIKLEDTAPIGASAVIADNLAYRMIANFFIKVNKPKGKYKVVANLEEALKWLNSLD